MTTGVIANVLSVTVAFGIVGSLAIGGTVARVFVMCNEQMCIANFMNDATACVARLNIRSPVPQSRLTILWRRAC